MHRQGMRIHVKLDFPYIQSYYSCIKLGNVIGTRYVPLTRTLQQGSPIGISDSGVWFYFVVYSTMLQIMIALHLMGV